MAVSGKTKGPSILERSLMWSVQNVPKTYEDKEEAAVPHSLLQPEPTEFLELKVISLCSIIQNEFFIQKFFYFVF